MKKAFLTSLCILTSLWLAAQGEMDNLVIESQPCLCRPGVVNKSPSKGMAIQYTYNPEFKIRPTDTENPSEVEANQRLSAKLKIPIINKPKVKFLLGFKYAMERYSFEDIDPENYPLFKRLNETDLKNAEAAAYLVVPINHKFYTSFRFSTSYRGDYGGFLSTENRFATKRAAGLFGFKKNDHLEYGIGVYYSNNVRRTSVYPFGFVNYTFNDKWGLEAAIPISIKLRRNLSDGNLMLFGINYSSQSYALTVEDGMNIASPDNTLLHYRRSSIEINTSYMKQFTGWTWMEFKLGYAINLNSQVQDIPLRTTYDLKPTGSIVATVAFFLSPPKKCLQ